MEAPQPPASQAIATKKRLYAKALDSLTSSSSVSLAASSSITSTKRPATPAAAFDEARERAAKRLRQSDSSSSLKPISIASATTTPRKIDAAAPKEPPNFAPWSQEAFLARLKTFSSVSLWHPKPDAINEVEWAKRGWVCVDVNTVRCRGGCEKGVVVNLESVPRKTIDDNDEDGVDAEEDDDEESAFEQALALRYKDVIVNGHADNCLWRNAGCRDDIYHLQVARASVWQPELRKRCEAVLEVSSAIEAVKTKPLDASSPNFSTPKKLMDDLPSDILGDVMSQADNQIAMKALEIALHGWHGTKASGTDLLQCKACFQRIGLWMYQPDYRPSHQKLPDDEEGSREDEDEESSTLDLIELHREHCPWRNPATQRASGSLAGLNACEILQRVVSTYARDHRRRSNERAGAEIVEPVEDDAAESAPYSKEEVARQDKERESRLRKLKSLFSIKRRSTKSAPKA